MCWQRMHAACPRLLWLGQRLTALRALALAYTMLNNYLVAFATPCIAEESPAFARDCRGPGRRPAHVHSGVCTVLSLA